MIIRHRDDTLVLIEQNEHGRLAGDLARAWGNDRFAAPAPLEPVALAAGQHDEGWREADALPRFNAAEQRPLHFRELPVEEHIPLYRSGVHAVAARDPYAGLLVGMHWTGLYRGRWGLQPRSSGLAGATAEAEQRRTEAVAEEERRWAAVKAELIEDGERRAPWEAALWHNVELLQALDLLSLFVATGPHDKAPADGEGATLGLALNALDQAAGERRIPAPTHVAGELCELVVAVREPGVVTVDPYPFAVEELRATLRGQAIAARRYADADDVSAALAAAQTVDVTCTFTPA